MFKLLKDVWDQIENGKDSEEGKLERNIEKGRR